MPMNVIVYFIRTYLSKYFFNINMFLGWAQNF